MWKRKHLTAQDNEKNMQYNQSAVLYHSESYQPSPVDEFYTEETFCASSKETCIHHVDPIIMLFNQQRLDNLGSMTAKQFLDSLQQQASPLEELRKKCSDDDLLKMIKSKYLQTPSEIMAYCRYIESNVDAFNKDVQAIVEQQQMEEKQDLETSNSE